MTSVETFSTQSRAQVVGRRAGPACRTDSAAVIGIRQDDHVADIDVVGRDHILWLNEGLDGRSAKTIERNEHVLAPILATMGTRRLRDHVHQALTAMARRDSNAAVAMGHNALTRAIHSVEI